MKSGEKRSFISRALLISFIIELASIFLFFASPFIITALLIISLSYFIYALSIVLPIILFSIFALSTISALVFSIINLKIKDGRKFPLVVLIINAISIILFTLFFIWASSKIFTG
jgi:hypothetical protein